jgi:UDP-N-acetylglucosamine 1-carboxyvinyltransferase
MKNININTAKNSALPILAAALLQKNLYYIRNIPLISDINVQINILKQFNVKVWHINNTNKIDSFFSH